MSSYNRRKDIFRVESAAIYGADTPHHVHGLEESSVIVVWKDIDGNRQRTHWNSGVLTPLLPDFSGSNNTSRFCLYIANDTVTTPLFCFNSFGLLT